MEPLFEERQSFRQAWLWVLMLASAIPVIAIVGAGLYQQIGGGHPAGHDPVGKRSLIGFVMIVLTVILSSCALLWICRLRVRVFKDEIVIHFRPFHFRGRRIRIADLAEVFARRYQPLGEYGGWGIRFSRRGMAYNVSGNDGVQLVLRNGKRVLIGSRRSVELERAIRELM